MQFTSILALAALVSSALASSTPVFTAKVTYDQTYDNADGSLSTVACSNGKNGLLTKGFTTFGSLPDFPYIGGAAAVAGWNSTNCGTCWNLTYQDRSINVLAVDHAGDGFNIALKALNELTNDQGVFLGHVDVKAVQVDAAKCGL